MESGPFACCAELAVIECPLGFFSIGQLLKKFTWLIVWLWTYLGDVGYRTVLENEK
ncbi:hypothetical protein CM49_00922 [Paenibacillus sp. P1XP2]|nr:hypothetical protein CM49_00922 [Paenibacillus sp. P1XP2]